MLDETACDVRQNLSLHSYHHKHKICIFLWVIPIKLIYHINYHQRVPTRVKSSANFEIPTTILKHVNGMSLERALGLIACINACLSAINWFANPVFPKKIYITLEVFQWVLHRWMKMQICPAYTRQRKVESRRNIAI